MATEKTAGEPRKLTVGTVLRGADGMPVSLAAGDTVPEEYTDQVGDHLYAEQPQEQPAAKRGRR